MSKHWNLFDKKFRRNKKKYIIQCVLALIAMSGILIFLNSLFQSAVLAAFGATCFIVFGMPHKHNSDLRVVLGGYGVGLIIGLLLRYLFLWISPVVEIPWLISILGAFAVAVSIFIMAVTNTEHPPAAGVALGIVLDGVEPLGITVLLLAVALLLLVKSLLKRWMMDLI